MIVAYIVAKFPNLTETFILNEIISLRKYGVDVRVFSIHNASPDHQIEGYLPPITYYDKDLSFNKFVAHFYFIKSLPFRYFRIFIKTIFKFYRSPKTYLQNLRTFSISIYFLYHLREHPVKLIHAHFINLPGSVAAVMSLLSGIPYSCSAHAQDIYTGNGPDIQQKIKASKFTVTCSAVNRAYLTDLCPIYSYKVFHIYHGLDSGQWKFRGTSTTVLKTLRVLSIGRLVEKKGFNDLLEAIAILVQKGIDITCSIVGDGPLRSALQTRAKEIGIDNVVHFYGALSHESIKDTFLCCDLFILACRIGSNGDRDGLPNVLLEAMAQGIPIIATNVSAVPELIKHRLTGMLVASGDPNGIAHAVMELISKPRLCSEMALSGRLLIEQEFGIDNSAYQLKMLFSGETEINEY